MPSISREANSRPAIFNFSGLSPMEATTVTKRPRLSRAVRAFFAGMTFMMTGRAPMFYLHRMIVRWRVLTGVLAMAATISAMPAFGAAPGPDVLSPETMSQATRLDSFSIPTPGELLAALNKVGKPNWQAQYRAPIPTNYTSRPQIALNLGGLIADGYIAIEAEDSQQVKNIGKDIVTLARELGVSENVLRRGKSIEDFAENNEWSTLKEELEATQNEVKSAMDEQHDDELITLVTLGGWIRGTQAVSGWIANNYTDQAAKLLRQPEIIALLRNRLLALPAKTQQDDTIKQIDPRLGAIQQMVSFQPATVPSIEDIKKLNVSATDLINQITKR